LWLFAVTHRAYYFIHFSGLKREKVGEVTSLPLSSTFGRSFGRNTPLCKSGWLTHAGALVGCGGLGGHRPPPPATLAKEVALAWVAATPPAPSSLLAMAASRPSTAALAPSVPCVVPPPPKLTAPPPPSAHVAPPPPLSRPKRPPERRRRRAARLHTAGARGPTTSDHTSAGRGHKRVRSAMGMLHRSTPSAGMASSRRNRNSVNSKPKVRRHGLLSPESQLSEQQAKG